MTFIEACRAWKAVHGSLPGKISLFFEGEEESGSPSLVPFMRDNAEELNADVAMICDTGLFGDDTPGIVTRLRGTFGRGIDHHRPVQRSPLRHVWRSSDEPCARASQDHRGAA